MMEIYAIFSFPMKWNGQKVDIWTMWGDEYRDHTLCQSRTEPSDDM